MKKELQKKTDLFLSNRKTLKEVIKLESEKNILYGAMMYTDEGREVNKRKLEKCQELLKEKTSIFSDLRTFSTPIAIKMSLKKNPEEYLDLLQKNYHAMTKKSVFGSYYKFLTSMIVCDYEKNVRLETISNREKRIYDLMKKKHPYLTGDEDLAFATLFALSGRREETLVNELEEYYLMLKDYIKGKNNAQTIAEILVLQSGNKLDKVNKVLEIYNLLKDNKKKINDDFQYSLIASFATLEEDSKTIVDAILEVDSYIGAQKGKGLWTLGKTARLMIAMMIVESVYCKSNRELKGISLINSIIVEEIITFMACISVIAID